jgi:hypothetical protein
MLPAFLRCLPAIALLLAATVTPAAADPMSVDPMSDGFEGGRIPPQIWSPCRRPEGRFFIDNMLARSGRYSAGMALLPTPDLPPEVEAVNTDHRRSGCIDSDTDMDFMAGSDQRAELWLRETEEKGTDLWYGFSFRIDAEPAPAADNRRLLVGQWKQAGQYSPFLGQRFRNRKFYLTVEQDGPARLQQCRVLVAWEDGFDVSEFPPHRSFLHDGFDAAGNKLAPDYTADCGSNLSINREASLPSPYGAWVDMVVHIKVNAQPDDLIEVWANGRKIVTVRGRLGYRDSGRQYFKIGPYRDPGETPVVAHLDNFGLGHSFEEVDPRRFDQ